MPRAGLPFDAVCKGDVSGISSSQSFTMKAVRSPVQDHPGEGAKNGRTKPSLEIDRAGTRKICARIAKSRVEKSAKYAQLIDDIWVSKGEEPSVIFAPKRLSGWSRVVPSGISVLSLQFRPAS
jgi:hypothetical protein